MALITSYILADLLVLIATIVVAIYFYFQWAFTYWNRKGVHQVWKPTFPQGSIKGASFTKHLNYVMKDVYDYDKSQPYSGIYVLQKPVLVLRDLELIKSILVKDFTSFHDHGFDINVKRDPLADHLFFLNGKEWRNLRIKLTPTFTSGKLKMMFPIMFEIGKTLVDVVEDKMQSPDVEVKEIVSRFFTDIISSVAFGIESNCLKNPDAEFRKFGQKVGEKNPFRVIQDFLLFFWPQAADILGVRMIEKSISDYFINTVDGVMDYRIKNNIKRNDFLQLLIQLKTLGYIPDANDSKIEEQKKDGVFTIEQAAAQAFIFLIAGFETSSSTMSFALYELALNTKLQEEVYQEIKKVKKNNNGIITYDALQEMELLGRVISETLRKYPVIVLTRQCNSTYQIPGQSLTLEKGKDVWIPVTGIHHDPEYYPNPEKFDPDRFLPEEKEKRHPFAYIPFGEGPRICIGNRFALMQVRVGLSIILENFKVQACDKTPIPLIIDPAPDVITPKGGLHLKISKRE